MPVDFVMQGENVRALPHSSFGDSLAYLSRQGKAPFVTGTPTEGFVRRSDKTKSCVSFVSVTYQALVLSLGRLQLSFP